MAHSLRSLFAQELEAIYGLHHETSREGSNSDEHHSLKTDDILRQVLAVLDKNGDGVVTKREFLSAGPGALPNFEGVEGLGHHYNSEGEVCGRVRIAGVRSSSCAGARPELAG